MTLWRKFNDVEDLIGIVKFMDFLQEVRTGSYQQPFGHKHFPIHVESFDDWVKEQRKLSPNGEHLTQRISQWVYSNCPYNAAGGNHTQQFNLAREAYYYYRRMEENVS